MSAGTCWESLLARLQYPTRLGITVRNIMVVPILIVDQDENDMDMLLQPALR